MIREYWSRFYKWWYYFLCGGDARAGVATQVYFRFAHDGPTDRARGKAQVFKHCRAWERLLGGGVGPWVKVRIGLAVENGLRQQGHRVFRSGQ